MSQLRLRLSGNCAELGLVPASDVARLILDAERALASAAYYVLRKPKARTGRYRQPVADAVRLRLLAVESGSVVPVLEVPEAPTEEGSLELHDPSLGEAALDELIGAAASPSEADPLMAEALLRFVSSTRVGERYDAVTFDVRRVGLTRTARLDGTVRQSLQAYVDSLPAETMRSDSVVGVLFEANFEKHTARLRSPAAREVEVTFDEEHADDIQAALRHQAALQGEVAYDPSTQAIRRVDVRDLTLSDQLGLPDFDPENMYFAARTFTDLAESHGTTAPVTVAEMHDAEATDDERAAFLAALAELELG